mgnify:CR=1 FL=1
MSAWRLRLRLPKRCPPSPSARNRKKARRELLRSPRLMGGLTRGRVRTGYGVEGSRKRERVAASGGTRLQSNSAAGGFSFQVASYILMTWLGYLLVPSRYTIGISFRKGGRSGGIVGGTVWGKRRSGMPPNPPGNIQKRKIALDLLIG